MKQIISFTDGQEITPYKTLPIKTWAPDLDDNTLQQAVNLTKLPFACKHIAIMPDAHLGYGMPIGGVLATKDVVIPNAVGVDIGCLDAKTEYMSPTGWTSIDKYKSGKVLQYNKETDTANFIDPQKYIKKKSRGYIKLKSKYGLDQRLSLDHKMLFWQGSKSRGYIQRDIIASHFKEKHLSLKKGILGGIKTTFSIETSESLDLTNDEIRFLVMISADGRLRSRKTLPNLVDLHFRKERKIRRAKKLIEQVGLTYRESFGKLKDTYLEIEIPDRLNSKDLSIFWSASSSQLSILCDECIKWDGHHGDHTFYSTTIKEYADLIQFAFATQGIRCGLYKSPSKEPQHKDHYIVYNTKNEYVGIPKTSVSLIEAGDTDTEYCFTVDSGYLVIRRNNKISITGNCGVAVSDTTLDHIDKSDLLKIIDLIRQRVPLGFNKHKEKQEERHLPVEEYPFIDMPVVEQEFDNARFQIGTLGGGNHFIEIQQGPEGKIWTMVHSGSRNLGYKVANHYNAIAKKLNKSFYSDVPPEYDLAFLPLSSEEGEVYLNEMHYCVKFARLNRYLIMARVLECFEEIVGPFGWGNYEDVPHNFASLENHFGRNMMIHRKGATKAMEDGLCIIPGSQGTSSFICKGKGNRDSFKSCSHGAGRVLGRKAARRTLDLIAESELLDKAGILHSIKTIDDLDEAPGAYKNIHEVMELQKDLVEPMIELKPIAVIKG